MDLHRLRLLDFNSFHGKEYKKEAKQKEVKHICLNSVDNNDILEKLSTNKTSTNSPSDYPLAKKPFFRLHTSRSEMVKTPVKDTLKSLGNCINSSLGDIYNNSFSIKKKTNPQSGDFFNGDNVPRSKKTRTNSRENRKSKDKKINILYSRDLPTSNSLRIKEKEGRIDNENNKISTFSKDIFGFPKTTNSEKLSTYRMWCSSHRNVECNNTQKESEHPCEPKHGDPEIIDLKLRSERKIADSSILDNKVNKQMQHCSQLQDKGKLPSNVATAVEGGISNSSIKPVKKVCYHDMGSSRDINRVPLHDTPLLLKRSTSIEKLSCSPQQDRHRQHKSKRPILMTICSKNKLNNMISSKKSGSNKPKTLISLISKSYKKLMACTKYIIYGSLIIIWAPCILVITLACKLTVKLANMLAKYPAKSCTKRIKKRPETHEKRWYRRARDSIVNTYNTFLSIPKIPKKKSSLCAVSAHPNPKKRYTLFYTNHRGWLMKPIQNNKKSISNHFYNMRCEQKTTFNRCSKCPDLHASNKAIKTSSTLLGKIDNSTGMSFKRGCSPIHNLPLPKKYNTCEPVIHLKPCPHRTCCSSKRRSLNKRYIKLSKAIPHCFDTKSCPQVHKEYGHAVCPRCGRRRRQGPLFHTNSCPKLRCCCISSPSEEQRCQPYYSLPARSKRLSSLIDRGHLRSIPANNHRNLPYNQSPRPYLKDNRQNLPYNHLCNQLPKGNRRLLPQLENRKWSCSLDAGKPRHDNSLPCQQSTYPFPIECECGSPSLNFSPDKHRLFHDFKNKRYSSPVSINNNLNKAKTQQTFFNKNKTEKIKCNKTDEAKIKEKRKIDKENYKLINENIKSKKQRAKMKREIEKEKYKNIKEQIILDRQQIKMHRKNKKCLCKTQINNENRRYVHMSKGANKKKRKSNTKRKRKNKPAIFIPCNKISRNTKNYFKDFFGSCEDDFAIGCNDILMTKRPFVYKHCPKLYICSQNCHRCLRQICSIYCILFSLSFWTSIFWCCSLCLCI